MKESCSVKWCWHQGMGPAGIQAAGCTVFRPSVVFPVLSSDLWWPKTFRRKHTEHTYCERGLTTIAEWGQWSCRSTWGEEDKIIIIISNSKGVHWGFINAHPYLHRINTRKIDKILLFSFRVCHYFMLLRRAKYVGEEVEIRYLYISRIMEIVCL